MCREYIVHNRYNAQSDLQETVRGLTEWVEYESWTYCKNCHLLHTSKMLPTYGTGKIDYAKSCVCLKGRYYVPMAYLYYLPIFFYVSWT